MRSWLTQHGAAFAAAFRKWARQRAAGILHAVVIGVALALPAGGYVVLDSLRGLTARVGLDPQISVFLDDATHDERARVDTALRREPRVARIQFVGREEALRALGRHEEVREVIAALGRNPLPDTFVVLPHRTDADALAALATELRGIPGVSRVQVDAEWARRLGVLARFGQTALGLLAGLLAVGLVATTFNTIRLQILTQRDEIEVSRLIGATDAFIQRPFLYLGALQGSAGGLVALGLVWLGLHLLNGEATTLAQSYLSEFGFRFLTGAESAALVAGSGLLSWAGALMSVSRYLLEIEAK